MRFLVKALRIAGKILLGLVAFLLVVVVLLNVLLRAPAAPPVAAAAPLPPDFIWGVSSSAFQSEGGRIDTNVLRLNDKDTDPKHDKYGNSVDFRHRYREDVGLAHDLGINTYRIGISWARVEPQKGKIDEAELAYYDDLMLALKQAGIQPLITLDHFAYPGWVGDQGGWTNPETVTEFVAYVGRIAARYHTDVHWWLTFNETTFEMAAEIGATHPGWEGAGKIRDHLIAAHRQSYDAIHALDPGAHVSSNIVWMGDTPTSRLLQKVADWSFLDQIADKIDYVALDYYASSITQAMGGPHWNWALDPPGLYRALRILADRYPKLPLLIAENGLATENGKPRPDGLKREDGLRDCVYWVQRARADGINVIGYMVWSLTDNFEWGSYTPRFGLYTVNVLSDPQLARIPTAAVAAYQQVIRDHGVPPDYRPVVAQHP